MKGFLILLLFIVSLTGYSQNNFDEFIKDLPTYNYPLDYSFINTKKTTINRKVCWKYWILPITQINKSKPDSLVSFQFDTTVINMYHQWDKKDWNKKEPISLYVPTMTGEFYCVCKSMINSKVTGIIWYFYQKDITYGHGAHYWLGTYDLKGELIDYIKIYENTSSSMVMESYRFERKFKFNNNRIVFVDKTISNELSISDSLPTQKNTIDTKLIKRSFVLKDNGKFEKED